jgi:antitoxin component of MazEF toxin-antitoxin module
MSKETKEDEVIALATVYQDGSSVRGKIPASVVKALRAKDGDVLAFERRSDGRVLVRKSNAAERKGLASKKGGKK